MHNKAPLVLMILDGWGYNPQKQHNAIAQAHTPQWDTWWKNCPHLLLEASGGAVGLPDDQMGNSEVGHMHIGAGRVIEQDFTRINTAIKNGSFAKNSVLVEAIQQLKTSHKALHIMGLLSPGGVHSHENHLLALLTACEQQQFKNIHLHLFLDGRDTPPQSALDSIASLQQFLQAHPIAQINSITGRYYAMDRDKRWERLQPVYDMLTQGSAEQHFSDAQSAIKNYYQHSITDEFIPPTLIGSAHPIQDGDSLLFFNFRADRARQITSAFINADFMGFKRAKIPQLAAFISMTQYDELLETSMLFAPIDLSNTFGEVIAQHGLSQLRIAETEKYAHVTFFFNGGKEGAFPREERLLIPSPKVATYDLQPEMSAEELTHALVKSIQKSAYDVYICNYANADMVGHSGNIQAAIKAIECLDHCMHQVGQALAERKGKLLITADHGNAEMMYNETSKQPHTAHTTEPVPLVYVGGGWHFNCEQGSLIDIAPTMLSLLGISPPAQMTGRCLLEKNHD